MSDSISMVDHPIRTLVVGGDADTRSMLESVARGRRHSVEAASEFDEALELYRKDLHDVVVLDAVGNSGMDASAFCRRLRELPASFLTKILTLSESGEIHHIDEVLGAGADGVVLPPFSQEAVEAQLAVTERRVYRARERGTQAPILLDEVTGLASHPVLIDRVRESVRRAVRDPDHVFAVLELDLDAFGPVVGRLGGRAADRVLAGVAERLRACVRDTDVVARIHGDRFAILLDDLHDLSDPARVARRIHHALERPFELDGDELHLTTGIGIALSLTGYENAERILWDAHNALRQAKVERPGATRMFDAEMDAKAQRRMEMEDRITEALDRGMMELWYQPVVSMETLEIVGLEALARMRDGKGGLVPPDEFIPVAEDSGLIERIGWWTLERASRRLAGWQERFSGPPLTLAVNLSARQFTGPRVFEEIRERIGDSAVAPGTLHLEITETAAMADTETAIRALEQIKTLRIDINIDDFGTGYSSLSHLCRLPVDTLKIDRLFVDGMTRSRDDLEVVRTIVGLADSLGLAVIAEGVETAEQAELLRELGCDLAQGYHFHRPMPADDVEDILEQQRIGA